MQNIGTPRIYIDHINYQKALGIYEPKNSSIDSLWVEGVGGLKSPTKLLEATSPSSPDSTYLDANYTIINENKNWPCPIITCSFATSKGRLVLGSINEK